MRRTGLSVLLLRTLVQLLFDASELRLNLLINHAKLRFNAATAGGNCGIRDDLAWRQAAKSCNNSLYLAAHVFVIGRIDVQRNIRRSRGQAQRVGDYLKRDFRLAVELTADNSFGNRGNNLRR